MTKAKSYSVLFFCIGAGAFLLILNRWLWPTPDEYFYANTARSIAAGIQGKEVCLSCLNTEHPALVPGVIAIFQNIFKIGPLDLIGSRIPMILFSLGTLILLWLIARKVGIKENERIWWLWLFLLIPGFFILSVRLMLDVPLTFGLTLLCYLLLSRAHPITIGFCVAFIALIKGYGILLTVPFVISFYLLEAFAEEGYKLKIFLFDLPRKLLAAFLPPLIIIVWILGANFLPFPRLLETNLVQYLGDGFIGFAKTSLVVSQKAVEIISSFIPSSASQTALETIIEKQQDLTLTNEFPQAILESPLKPEAQGSFWDRLWLIYRYNFSEQDISVFLLPLFLTGLIIRIRRLIELGKQWIHERADQLFLILMLIFAYLNWHEALNIHGFRLTLPLIPALIYFSYWGARPVLIENQLLPRRLFGILFFGSLFLYGQSLIQINYGSVISDQPLLEILLKYKLYLFGTVFLTTFGFIWFYSRIKWTKKSLALIFILVSFFFIKLLPFGLEAKAATDQFEYDYGLAKASPLLEELKEAKEPIITNLRPYVMHYYANNLKLPNVGAYPLMREFKEAYPELYSRYYLPDRPITKSLLEDNQIRILFFVNREVSDNSWNEFETMIKGLELPLRVVAEAHHPRSGRLQWIMYQVESFN